MASSSPTHTIAGLVQPTRGQLALAQGRRDRVSLSSGDEAAPVSLRTRFGHLKPAQSREWTSDDSDPACQRRNGQPDNTDQHKLEGGLWRASGACNLSPREARPHQKGEVAGPLAGEEGVVMDVTNNPAPASRKSAQLAAIIAFLRAPPNGLLGDRGEPGESSAE